MPYFINTDLISSLLDPKLVDPESTLIDVGAYTIHSVMFLDCMMWFIVLNDGTKCDYL